VVEEDEDVLGLAEEEEMGKAVVEVANEAEEALTAMIARPTVAKSR
jgi:hypothetical protein